MSCITAQLASVVDRDSYHGLFFVRLKRSPLAQLDPQGGL